MATRGGGGHRAGPLRAVPTRVRGLCVGPGAGGSVDPPCSPPPPHVSFIMLFEEEGRIKSASWIGHVNFHTWVCSGPCSPPFLAVPGGPSWGPLAPAPGGEGTSPGRSQAPHSRDCQPSPPRHGSPLPAAGSPSSVDAGTQDPAVSEQPTGRTRPDPRPPWQLLARAGDVRLLFGVVGGTPASLS